MTASTTLSSTPQRVAVAGASGRMGHMLIEAILNSSDCVLAAANLGNDADTTAAIAGQLAGACYGYQAIRESWRAVLHRHEEIVALADQLFFLSQQLATHSEAS